METLWFILVAFMITMYVVLDGFDLGAGVVHLIAAKTNDERRKILNAIGPVWDGNEVWLVAGGGVLYFAFPLLYASSFSGFYLPLMIVLWLLMLRGAGIELRHQINHPLWTVFWDVVFSLSSILLTIFFGAALGNVVRGVPLRPDGYFFEPLWTTFTVVPEAGILDWFTVIMGFVAFSTLTMHGANYISLKTDGDIQQRCRRISSRAWWGTIITSIAAFISTLSIRPTTWDNFVEHPWGYIFPVLGMAALVAEFMFRNRQDDPKAFFASATFIVSMMTTTAFALYPVLLPASTDRALSITISNAAAGSYGLRVGIVWWIIGIVLASGYFVYTYRSFRGKVKIHEEETPY